MSSIRAVRAYGLLDGATLLFLVLVAMPLKYLAGMPLAVRVMGSVHGLFFVLFVVSLVRATTEHRWSRRIWLPVLLAAVVPGGVFFFERMLRDVSQDTSKGERARS